MCLYTKNYSSYEEAEKAKTNPIILKKDLKVYKVLYKTSKGALRSFFREFKYEKGMHYYQTGNKPFGDIQTSFCGLYLIIKTGLHAYVKKSKIKTYCNESIYLCIIPKGAKVYYGKHNDIVTDQLILPK